MKKIAILLTASLLFAEEEINLLEDLNSASEISTKTKLNINQTPAIVSVLHANELQKLGITDVYGALETVPGIEISMGIGGAKQINMRGNKSIVTDKIKFMIDGISINAELSGANHFYLNMPIENVERIEIIRGPASALYGSFAHIGVINIITKASTQNSSTAFLRASSNKNSNIGFTQHVNTQKVQIGLSGSFEKNLNTREYKNYSKLPSDMTFNSYEDFTDKSLGINITFLKDFHLTSKFLKYTTQNYYGYGTWPIVQDPKDLTHTSFVNEFSYTPQISRNLALNLKVGHKYYSMIGESRLVPYSILGYSYDLIGSGDYSENSRYSDLSLSYKIKDNSIILGTYIAYTNADGTRYDVNNYTVSEETDIPLEGGGLQNKISRTQYASYISDIYNISPKWTTNIGLRYDYYSDADNSLSPKLALLYNQDEKQNYKLMYQRSFRAPSFVELYGSNAPFIGDKNLKSETIDTIEMAYRFENSFDSWFSINFFYSDMQNFITRNASLEFVNSNETFSYGSEVEFKYPLLDMLSLQANYSYVYMKENNGDVTPLISNSLANVMLSYQISNHWNTGTKIRYVGRKKREESDTRDDLNAYTDFDQTITYTHKELIFQVTVKNIFDSDIIYPAPVGNEITSGTYKDDLVQDGRTLWCSLEWRFR
jgi:iron complex outermembrane receptor protein